MFAASFRFVQQMCIRDRYITALVYILISYILALLANRLVIPDNLISVSYTHLDVYKRQM